MSFSFHIIPHICNCTRYVIFVQFFEKNQKLLLFGNRARQKFLNGSNEQLTIIKFMKYNKTNVKNYKAYRRHIADETVKLISNYFNFYLHGSQLQFKFFRVILSKYAVTGFFSGGQIVNSNY